MAPKIKVNLIPIIPDLGQQCCLHDSNCLGVGFDLRQKEKKKN